MRHERRRTGCWSGYDDEVANPIALPPSQMDAFVNDTPPAKLSEAEAANELMRLARTIAKHNKLYHTEDSPEISDADYDALVRRNNELEEAFPHLVRDDSPNRAVGAAVANSPLSKVTHEQRMYSLDNAFADEDITEWIARVRRFLNLPEGEPVTVTAEDKIDGLSCALRYEKGKLVLADRKSTRLNSSHVKISYAVFCLKKKKLENSK